MLSIRLSPLKYLFSFNTGTTTVNSVAEFNATTTFSGNVIGSRVINQYTASTTLTGNTSPQPVFMATSTGAMNLSDANDLMASYFDGFAITNALNNENVYVQTDGIVGGFTGLSTGLTYYVQDVVGTIGTPVGSYNMRVGKAVSATSLLIEKNIAPMYIGYTSISTTLNQNSCGTDTATIPTSDWTMLRTTLNVANGRLSHRGDVTLSKYGRISGTTASRHGDGASPQNVTVSLAVATSTGVMTLSGGGMTDTATNYTCTAGIYMYR